ncbi:MAG: endonuclease dU, partial [Candidatus Syntropharchaeales archaeon]
MNLYKHGLRVLGIAESFKRRGERSILAGVVMRADSEIDGVAVASASVGGLDATDAVLRIFKKLSREDINIILLNGAVVSWFNIIEIDKLYDHLRVPIISVTYEESEGLERYIREYFGDSVDFDERIRRYRELGERC